MEHRIQLGECPLRRGENVVLRNIAGENLLIPVCGEMADLQRAFTLTPVGAHIWDLLNGETEIDMIINGIVETFDVDREQAGADCCEFLVELIGANLVETMDE
ncbi:MAG: PqqD family protein [Verrucomicrobia bacterium]|nr:PqqD family protein [Verrucomicrobiota bacterium]MDA1087216.1 PqqD family protein [Verrucomicrobiota bacterium]